MNILTLSSPQELSGNYEIPRTAPSTPGRDEFSRGTGGHKVSGKRKNCLLEELGLCDQEANY